MSYSSSRGPYDELCRWIQLLYDECITPEQCSRLANRIREDKDARRVYVQHMHMYAGLYWDNSQEPERIPLRPNVSTPSSVILGFLGECFEWGVGFLQKSNVFALLVAVGLPSLILAVLVLSLIDSTPDRAPRPVAAIARTYDCVGQLDGDGTQFVTGAKLMKGQRLTLRQGFAEIAFTNGAEVILEGPATFSIEGVRGGRLANGALAAKVPPAAQGFTVATPAANVDDLGTEFGVNVEEGTDVAEVHVFKGTVELFAGEKNSLLCHLVAGSAIQVEPTTQGDRLPRIRGITADSNRFVRSLPFKPATAKPAMAEPTEVPSAKVETAITADFSGGAGESQADQYPGTAGQGWVGPWRLVGEVHGAVVSTSVEQSDAIDNSGAYLKFTSIAQTDRAYANNSVTRRFQSIPGVNITRPYVVSFRLRVDAGIDLSTDGTNGVSIAGDSVERLQSDPATGWIIEASLSGAGDVSSRHWRFIGGDGQGKPLTVNSGVDLRPGSVYAFTVLVDPQARTWSPSIRVDGDESRAYQAMRMQSTDSARKNKRWSMLNFQWQTRGATNAKGGKPGGFSIDTIRICSAKTPETIDH